MGADREKPSQRGMDHGSCCREAGSENGKAYLVLSSLEEVNNGDESRH